MPSWGATAEYASVVMFSSPGRPAARSGVSGVRMRTGACGTPPAERTAQARARAREYSVCTAMS
eukprot:15456763-Alexandrium_andersonii.AAC.1